MVSSNSAFASFVQYERECRSRLAASHHLDCSPPQCLEWMVDPLDRQAPVPASSGSFQGLPSPHMDLDLSSRAKTFHAGSHSRRTQLGKVLQCGVDISGLTYSFPYQGRQSEQRNREVLTVKLTFCLAKLIPHTVQSWEHVAEERKHRLLEIFSESELRVLEGLVTSGVPRKTQVIDVADVPDKGKSPLFQVASLA